MQSNLSSVHFADTSVGWAVSLLGDVLKTTNGGSSWTSKNITSWALQGLHFVDASKGWTVGDCRDDSVTYQVTVSSLSTAMDSVDVTCNGGTDGEAMVAVSGGTTPYDYAWEDSGGNAVSSNNDTITDLPAGEYFLTVTDSSGCVKDDSVTVNEPAALTTKVDSVEDVSCSGAGNGSAYITVTGGTSPYSYAWSNGDTTEDLTGIRPGTYTVTVTDANGCEDIASVEVSDNSAPMVSATVTDVSVRVYPNPSRGLFKVALEGPVERSVELRVLDMHGRAIERIEIDKGGSPVRTLDLKGVSKGVYHLEIRSGKAVVHRRIVIQ